MGLTIHYHLTAPAGTNEAQAKELVETMRRVAVRFYCDLLVDEVLSIVADAKTLRRFAADWLTLPIPGRPNTKSCLEIMPESGWLFVVRVGEDCEPLQLGLCRYPKTVWDGSREVRTKGGRGWRLSGSSKTQFASLHGWEHFARCHQAVVHLLAELRTLGLRVKISDEGEYWPHRSLTKLRSNLAQMNGLVAATAGALKDMDTATNGEGGVQSPIFQHHHFERLEHEGRLKLGGKIEQLEKRVRKELS